MWNAVLSVSATVVFIYGSPVNIPFPSVTLTQQRTNAILSLPAMCIRPCNSSFSQSVAFLVVAAYRLSLEILLLSDLVQFPSSPRPPTLHVTLD